MAHPNKVKGDRAEREAATLLTQLLKRPVRRKLGAGRKDDTGDIDGIADWTVQVKNRRDIARCIREGMPQLEQQRQNAQTENAAMMVRQSGGGWLVIMTAEQYAKLIR